LTKLTRDGGYDVHARIATGTRHEFVLIECKKYAGRVGVPIVRQLFGTTGAFKANRGVLVTSGTYTKDANNFAKENNMQLIDGDELVCLFNEYLGANWSSKIEHIVTESLKHNQTSL
jgi:restriction endonuclease Mrr